MSDFGELTAETPEIMSEFADQAIEDGVPLAASPVFFPAGDNRSEFVFDQSHTCFRVIVLKGLGREPILVTELDHPAGDGGNPERFGQVARQRRSTWAPGV